MTADEAIKLIEIDLADNTVDWDSLLGVAYKLSFEALKRHKWNRTHSFIKISKLLPGETEVAHSSTG